jgi:hypothetical protein
MVVLLLPPGLDRSSRRQFGFQETSPESVRDAEAPLASMLSDPTAALHDALDARPGWDAMGSLGTQPIDESLETLQPGTPTWGTGFA